MFSVLIKEDSKNDCCRTFTENYLFKIVNFSNFFENIIVPIFLIFSLPKSSKYPILLDITQEHLSDLHDELIKTDK